MYRRVSPLLLFHTLFVERCSPWKPIAGGLNRRAIGSIDVTRNARSIKRATLTLDRINRTHDSVRISFPNAPFIFHYAACFRLFLSRDYTSCVCVRVYRYCPVNIRDVRVPHEIVQPKTEKQHSHGVKDLTRIILPVHCCIYFFDSVANPYVSVPDENRLRVNVCDVPHSVWKSPRPKYFIHASKSRGIHAGYLRKRAPGDT